MAQVPTRWTEQRRIESFDVDSMGRLRPQTLFGYLLNAAWNHASGTIYGYKELSERNLFWVLIKVQLLIERLPAWGEQMTIETWGKRVQRLYALRDFRITSLSGEKLVSATSSWMVLDRSTGRPQRLSQDSDGFPWQPEQEELQTTLEKVPEPESPSELASFRVLFSDIDVNHHVDSTRYLQWMIDSHSQRQLETNVPGSIELSFLSEALPDDKVSVFAEPSGNQELCVVRRLGDGKDLCRARFQWRPA